MYEIQTTELFKIKTDELIIGNYKYGKIINAHKKKIFSDSSNLFCISIKKKGDAEIDLQSLKKDKLSFYNYHGRFNDNKITYERNFAFGENAILEIRNILSNEVQISYTNKFRNWTLSRFSKMNTIGNSLTDITTLRLLKDKILSFHGASFDFQGDGYIITAFPDTGKSYTILKLLENKKINFIAEDILMLDKNNNILSVPFTQTIEKRKKLSPLNKIKKNLYNYIYKDNYIKSDVFESINLPDNRVSSGIKLKKIFFLKKGKNNVQIIDKKEKSYKLLRDLNNLEFSYWRNELILFYLFFQSEVSIYDFMEIENNLIKNICDKTEIIEVTGETFKSYNDLINNYLINNN